MVTSSVSKVNDAEQPSGATLVAVEDVYVPAVDASGNPLRHGRTLVASRGGRIPAAYLDDEAVTSKAITASEFADLAPEPADAEPADERKPVGKLTVDDAKAELDEAGVEYDADAKRDDLRALVAELRDGE